MDKCLLKYLEFQCNPIFSMLFNTPVYTNFFEEIKETLYLTLEKVLF